MPTMRRRHGWDGYTSVLHCEFAEEDLSVAPDSEPIYCNFDEEVVK